MEGTVNTVAPVVKKKRKKIMTWDDLELLLLTLPTTAWYVVFCYLPMFGILLAFKEKYTYKKGMNFFERVLSLKWVGFDNMKSLQLNPQTGMSVRNTLLYNVVFIVLGLVLSITLAILISQLYSQKYAKICQTMMFLPHFLSWVVVSYFVFAFLSQQYGLVNRFLATVNPAKYDAQAGGTPINWYSTVKAWPYIIVFMALWKGTGYNMVVYLASLSGIDQTYYEAALIDGATKWQQVKHITLPMLRSIATILFILSVGKIFNSDFGLFYQMPRNSGAIYNATLTLDVQVYNALMSLNMPHIAQSIALLQSVAGCITICIANLVVKKIDADSSLF